jgi:hypothetical protein
VGKHYKCGGWPFPALWVTIQSPRPAVTVTKYVQKNITYIHLLHTHSRPSLRPKIGQLLFGQPVWRKIIFFQFFLLDRWTIYFTNFPWTPSMSNFDSIWARGVVLLKMGIKLIFLVFHEELLHEAMWLKLPKDWCSKNILFCP